uniref:CHK kinase-like domain-containing protein n=1 Tax=Plectus sambesii TaxID=2011161 RepID=A0A914V9X1_9BILA
MEKVDGLCGSRVQKEWLEAALQTALQTRAHFGPNFSSTQFGIGQGFFSIIIRVICDWQGEGANELPASFVLKCPSLGPLLQMNGPDFEEHREGSFGLLKKAHACEVSFYNMIKTHQLKLHVPKVYYSHNVDADGELGLIVMEDLTQSAAVKPTIDGLPLKGLETIMENFATLHAFSLTNTEWLENSELKAYLFEGQSLLLKGWVKDSIETLRKLGSDLFSDSYLERLTEIIGPQFDRKYAYHVHEELGIPPVLTHGDLHNSNIMWKKSPDGNGTTDELAVIVDWQIMHPGCVGEDFARLFCGSIEADIRREHTNHLLEHYHKTLTARLNKEPPFTLDQLKQAYRRLFKFGAGTYLPAFAFYAQRMMSEGKVAENDIVLRRCKAVIDDLFEIENELSR